MEMLPFGSPATLILRSCRPKNVKQDAALESFPHFTGTLGIPGKEPLVISFMKTTTCFPLELLLFWLSDPRRRAEHHPVGNGGGRRHQILRQRPGHQRAAQPLPARQDHVRPAAGHVQPVQPGRRLAHHEPQKGVPHNAARQARMLLHQGNRLTFAGAVPPTPVLIENGVTSGRSGFL